MNSTWKKGEHIISTYLYFLVIWSECGFTALLRWWLSMMHRTWKCVYPQCEGREKEGEENFLLGPSRWKWRSVVNKPSRIRLSCRIIYSVLSLIHNIRDADISKLSFIFRITPSPYRRNPEINLAPQDRYRCGCLVRPSCTDLERGHPVRVEVIRFKLRRSQRFLRFPEIPAGAGAGAGAIAAAAAAAVAAAQQQQQQQQGKVLQGSRTPFSLSLPATNPRVTSHPCPSTTTVKLCLTKAGKKQTYLY